ncbi:hypothetical protein OIU84_014656, partial [Salix udensis]
MVRRRDLLQRMAMQKLALLRRRQTALTRNAGHPTNSQVDEKEEADDEDDVQWL